MTGRLTFTSSTYHPAFFAKTSGVNCCNHSIDRRTFLARRSTRNVVLNAGSKLFIERGFSACSVQDITDAAGVPKGSFYNHFESKEALAAAALEYNWNSGICDQLRILSDASVPPRTRLARYFERMTGELAAMNFTCG